ncbi:hypothetical protein SLE2022_401080 [Rubroshorea leprosula]
MEEDDRNLRFCSDRRSPFSLVSLASFSPISSPSQRRLSSNYAKPSQPVLEPRRLAWVSLCGRLVNAEEASSAKSIGGGGGSLGRDEAVAWELFTPIQRFLIVAVIGVAASQSKKDLIIQQLKRSVELRDHVLAGMQQKLDNLCEELSNVREQPGIMGKNGDSPVSEAFGSDSIKFVECGCWFCDQHHERFVELVANPGKQTCIGDEMLHYKMNLANGEAEPEERRMSDLSDLASSVTSAADIQFNNLVVEHDIFNLKKECEEKNATIKELTTFIQSSDMTGSKRISELEDIIRRKNMTITRLKKDMVVLEQRVMQLTRLNRPSSSVSNSNCWQLPVMTDNLLYDMDSTTSPSSSDSDCSPKNQLQAPTTKVKEEIPLHKNEFTIEQTSAPQEASTPSALVRQTDWHSGCQSVSPLREIAMNQKSGAPSRQRPLSASGDRKRIRRRSQSATREATPNKRWV